MHSPLHYGYRLLSLMFAVSFSACTHEKEDEISTPETPVIIYSSDFENNQQPVISDWMLMYDYYPGINYDTLVNSTCPEGGSWALNLKAQKLHYSIAEKYLTNLAGTKDLTLSFYAELISGQNSVTASLIQIRNGAEIYDETINLGVWNDWEQFTFRDSVTLQGTDSLCIRFKALGSTYESSDVMLDRILLEENQ